MNHYYEFSTRLRRDVDKAIFLRVRQLNANDSYQLRSQPWNIINSHILIAVIRELKQL